VLMTSASGARALGVPEDRWVYLWASAGATDRWYVSDRRDYWSSPALRTAGARALGAAGITVDQIRYVDLYSCFPSSVQISQAALGIADDDPRGVTVTGGLPYAGGPASNYTMHAIATMAAKLRAEPGAVGLVSALGWYVAKHAIGIYSAAPPSRPWSPIDPYDDAVEGNDSVPALALEAVGQGTIETCTVAHDRDGVPVRGFVIGRLADGRRFVANTPEDPSTFQALMADDSVGRPGRVSSANGINRFDPR
jgi:acetyl-CoA C-acetyltransferase